MKIAILFSLFAATMAFPGLSTVQTWLASFQQPILNLIDNPYRKSTIPQFILDTQHPWILSNQRKLESLPNAEAFLCFDRNFDIQGKQVEGTEAELDIPPDLFENLTIDNNPGTFSRPGWPNALERLTEINRCPLALARVKALHVNIFVHHGEYADLWLKALEPNQPSEQLLALFGDVLESMTGLNSIKGSIRTEDAHFFEESFKARNLTLPTVTNLETGALSRYLVGMCPNLERLETGSGYDWNGYSRDEPDWRVLFIQSAALVPGLRRFAMSGSYKGWDPELATEIVKAMPQIESLGLYGSVGSRLYTEDNDKFENILEILASLKNLTHIDLPYSSSLAMGFDGGHWCGNAYEGKNGREYGREVSRQFAETTEKAGDMVMSNLPRLSSFEIGETPNITRAENGTVTLTWPWTGRIDEWTFEIWPEVDDFGEVWYDSM
ncbi:hypothetical protein BKA65DRAFT_519262 [Rhexocercosporidium sp. MPI-PUGE-AT-0058]|nr:hypothetical protein BKA65DRAFT_519262 [Rhexocercosporidium sp. MPI-PUGE-AT-0058]